MSTAPAIVTGIQISASEITALKFDTKQKSIIALHQQPLAPNVISKGQVTDAPALESAVKQAVVAARAHETSVILGFPEDKTFTSTIKKPNVADKELDQAIYWQAQEVLPDKVDNLYFDFKLVSEHAVLVSTPKAFLDPFIAATVKAGVNPIACEPTSLTLSRLAPPQKLSLIIQVRKSQTDICMVNALGIVKLSAIVHDPNQIVTQISSMNAFYYKKYQQKLTSIYVCGEGATPAWIDYLKKQTKLQATLVTLPQVKNMPANSTNFASIISLVNKDPAPTKSLNTINLLPKVIQTSYIKQSEKKAIGMGLKAAMVTLGVTTAILLAGLITIKLNTSKIQAQIDQLEQSTSQTSYTTLANQAETANIQARLLDKLPSPDNMQQVISTINQTKLAGISLSFYTIDLSDSVVLLNGTASTREILLKFKNQLEQNELFKLVSIPLPTLEQSQNIQFSLAIELNNNAK